MVNSAYGNKIGTFSYFLCVEIGTFSDFLCVEIGTFSDFLSVKIGTFSESRIYSFMFRKRLPSSVR